MSELSAVPLPEFAPLPELESHLGYWLRRVSNHVSAEFARLLQARQVTVAEWVALRHPYGRSDLTPGLAGTTGDDARRCL